MHGLVRYEYKGNIVEETRREGREHGLRVDESDDSATRHLRVCAASAICSERLASVAQPPRSAGRRSSMESQDGAEDVASGMAIGASGLFATEAVRTLATSLHLPSPAALTAATLKAYCVSARKSLTTKSLAAAGSSSCTVPLSACPGPRVATFTSNR